MSISKDLEFNDSAATTADGDVDNDRLDDAAVHVFAHCMWWVSKGDSLPADNEHRNLLWRDECFAWVREARQVLLHMQYNGLMVKRR